MNGRSYSVTLKLEIDKILVERILRRINAKNLSEYLNSKLLQDLEGLL